MRSTISTLIFALIANFSFATVLRVNNNPGVNNGTTSAVFFTSLSAAISAAANNDIIIVEASLTPYTVGGSLTKPLKIYGNGSFNTVASGTQINTATSDIQGITFSAGSENSLISGLQCGVIVVNTNNITIERCYANSVTLSGANNTTIRENLFINNGVNTGGTNLNVLCKNNIVNGGGLNISAGTTGMFENNIIGWAVNGTVNLGNAVVNFRNNIICSGGAITNYSNASVTHNISTIAATLLPAGNNNTNSVAYSTIFQGFPSTTTPANAQLKVVVSPALAAGYDSGDIGAYNTVAGKSTFRTEQVPPIPSVYQMTTGAVNGSTMNVTISTKANN